MIIIWKGMGIVVLLLAAGFAFVLGFGVMAIAPEGGIIARIAMPVATIISGICTIAMGFKMNAHGTEHSVYFLPVQYWGFVIITLGCIMFTGLGNAKGQEGSPESDDSIDSAAIMNLSANVGRRTKSRAWTNNEGKKLTGRLVGLSPDGTKVRIESNNGKTYNLDTDVVVEKDQKYIRKVHTAVQDESGSASPPRTVRQCTRAPTV